MKRRRRRGERFSEESVDPMNYVSNLSDAMLVLAVGMMLALIVHWNVDISTGGRSSENVGETVAAEGQGGQSAIDRDNALSFTPEELEQTFGGRILSLVQEESEDKERTWRERKASTIEHLKQASREVKLLTLGDKLSNMRSTARDYMVIGDEIWQRFNEKNRESHRWYLAGILDGLQDLRDLAAFQELERLYQLVYETR